jgi:hypothetical protein
MRKWLAVILLVFMPLQLSWAAVDAYCQHEDSIAAKHVGHHEHQHKGTQVDDLDEDPTKPSGFDSDCATCLAGSATPPSGMKLFSLARGSSIGGGDYRAYLATPPLERPERPKWHLLA